MIFYPHPIIMRELSRLQLDRKKRKVDHPVFDQQNPSGKGSKDVADCVCAVAQYFIDAYTETRNIVPPVKGMLKDSPEDAKYGILEDFHRRVLGA